MAELKLYDYTGSFNKGFDRGRDTKANNLLASSYQTEPVNRNRLLSDISATGNRGASIANALQSKWQNQEGKQAEQDQLKFKQKQVFAQKGFEVMSTLPPEQRQQAWESWVNTGSQIGLDMGKTPLEYSDQNLMQLQFIGSGKPDRDKGPATVQEWQYFNSLPKEDQGRFLNMKRAEKTLNLGDRQVVLGPQGGVDQSFDVGLKPQDTQQHKAGVKTAETEAKSQEGREQSFIDRGISAADSTASIRRSIELLDDVETGGYDKLAIQAKQIFGVEGADEGELTNNLGKAVLGQLRETFGAQFTQTEGDRLANMEASLGRSPDANKRILKNALKFAERIARRGLAAAKARGDDFSAQEIEDAMKFTIGGASQTKQQDRTGWTLMEDSSGNKALVGPNGEIEEQ